MKTRIGYFNDTYWVEIKEYFVWRKATSIDKYINGRYGVSHIIYFKSYEEAIQLANEYLLFFGGKRVAVYSRPK